MVEYSYSNWEPKTWTATGTNTFVTFDFTKPPMLDPDNLKKTSLKEARTWRGHLIRALVSLLEK